MWTESDDHTQSELFSWDNLVKMKTKARYI